MNEKDEALRLADDLRARIAYRPSRDSTQTLLTCDDAARCIEKLHADNERLRGLLREIADETYDSWTNGARAQRIAESALKEVPR
jgi:hypothetical protein